MAAAFGSATKRMPSGPNASGPADLRATAPSFIPSVRAAVMGEATRVSAAMAPARMRGEFMRREWERTPGWWIGRAADVNLVWRWGLTGAGRGGRWASRDARNRAGFGALEGVRRGAGHSWRGRPRSPAARPLAVIGSHHCSTIGRPGLGKLPLVRNLLTIIGLRAHAEPFTPTLSRRYSAMW